MTLLLTPMSVLIKMKVVLRLEIDGVEWIQIKEGEIMAISFKEEFHANAFWNLIDEYQRKY